MKTKIVASGQVQFRHNRLAPRQRRGLKNDRLVLLKREHDLMDDVYSLKWGVAAEYIKVADNRAPPDAIRKP